MTTSELAKELEKYPKDTRVVIRGYAGGLCDVDNAEETKIYLNCFKDVWYYGNHEEVSSLNESHEGNYEKVPAVYLN
jgi:hypothetical protein